MHFLHTIWFGYAWPSLKGNGPEALIQTVVYAALAVIFVPIIRRFAKAEMAKVHARLSHIIKHHPDLPDFPGDE